MSLEDGLDELSEGDVEIGGLRLLLADKGDEGFDDLPDVTGDTAPGAGDGDDTSGMRYSSKEMVLYVKSGPLDGGTGDVQPGDHDALAAQLADLRKVLGLLPDDNQKRLVRWRRRGEQARRRWYEPPHGQPLTVPGDQARQAFANTVATVRLSCTPYAVSDDLHEHTFAAGETFDVVNAGSQTMRQPTSWSLEAPGPVTIEHLDYPGEYLRFPAGPLSVSDEYDIEAPDQFGIVYGRTGSWHPTWIYLRPGSNPIKASAPCTLRWRDSF